MGTPGKVKVNFTAQQLADWRKYEHVRQDGSFNMFDPRASFAAGLSAKRYFFVMQNYSELKEAQPETAAAAISELQ